jgi:succinate dehydrogenase / fumarate reductase cytochrome b subunit
MVHRPRSVLSPHLTIYRPQLTSLLSILHRLSGVALYVFACLWAILLFYADVRSGLGLRVIFSWISSSLGQVFTFCWLLCLFFYCLCEVRYAFWDAGWGFDLSTVYFSGYSVLGVTFFASLGVWWFLFG